MQIIAYRHMLQLLLFYIYQGELTMVIHESAEDYLETILMLSKKLPVVRSIDIANEMGYKKIKCKYRHEKILENQNT